MRISGMKGSVRPVLIAIGICAGVCAAGVRSMNGQAGHTKLDAALQGVTSGSVRVIVGTAPGASASVADHLRGRGRLGVKRYDLIDAVTAEVPIEELAILEDDPAVTRVSIDAPLAAATAGGNGPGATPRPLLATLGLPLSQWTGKGVGVAVIDSGVDPGGDFSGIAEYDFTGAPNDAYGHGTHVAGLIASRGNLSQQAYAGVATKARLVSLKVLDAQGRGSTSTVIDALEFATANRAALGIDVINLSLGHPIFEPASTDPLVQAVEAAVRAGIAVVVSAGNVGRNLATGEPGYAGILSPANAPSAITVGALDSRNTASRGDDGVAAYSSRGPTWYDGLPKPDLVAPGQDLVSDAAIGSTLYLQFPDRQVTGNGGIPRYLRLSGTSMSAAVTTGVVALMIEASRDAYGAAPTPAMIKAILEYTALPVAGADPLTQGHGALNAAGAVSLTLGLGAAPSVDMLATPPLAPTTTIANDAWTWAQTFGWSDSVVWGNGDGMAPAWAQSVVWGNIGWGDSVVWGNTGAIVWPNLFAWSDSVVWGNTDGVY